MLDLATLKRQWGGMAVYERFEQIVSRFVMLLIRALPRAVLRRVQF